MHGLINRGYQIFLTETFGWAVWEDVCRALDLPAFGFESMVTYELAQTEAMIGASTCILNCERDILLENFGGFIISQHVSPTVRRLLCMGGHSYREFLANLIDLKDRVHLAIPDLDLPRFQLKTLNDDRYVLDCEFRYPNYGAVFLGMLRAMADDCDALVSVDPAVEQGIGKLRFDIRIFESDHGDSYGVNG